MRTPPVSQPLLGIDPRRQPTRVSSVAANIFLWPFQWLTYATLLYSSSYILLTLATYIIAVPVVFIAAALVPCAVLRSTLCLAIHGDTRYQYPWSVLFSCTRRVVLADVWLHNVFAPSSKRVALQHDMSSKHTLVRGYQPRFVVRVVDIDSPRAMVAAWAYLLGVRVVATLVFVVWCSLVAHVTYGIVHSIYMLASDNSVGLSNASYGFLWGDGVSCTEHPIGFFGVTLLAFSAIALLRRPLIKLIGSTTRRFTCESVLVLNHDQIRV
ncbi:hypothetical protein ACHHYP_14903 [Achlya hypogyna]|uniref:Transmembrane protein n=1 Tax=Achlya hypogyna TaxID=1202772 RepID=A0A1V9YC48_ACHHY|nr:hypothetical protein ACHHYP_14903 [Achlya hypogyna]